MTESLLERLRSALAERYELVDVVGHGGMATVYLARDLKHGRRVAIKLLRPELAEVVGPGRFAREIETTAALRHPNILPLFDSGEAAGQLFYVMPYVEGESLRQRLERERQLPLADAFRITLEVADALAYAHSQGVVHRDVKPENILLESGHAVVADFGIARAIAPTTGRRLTQVGLVIGTPAYMSPEQAGGDELDGRSDQYSLACVLYEALSGEPPHTGPTPQAVLIRSLTGEVRPIQPVRTTVPTAVDDVLKRALATTPADRYATCYEFAEALRAASTTVLTPATGQRPVRRRAGRIGAAAVVVVTLLAAALGLQRLLNPPPAVATSRLGIAVFPFRDTGGGAAEWSEGLGDLLATALDGTPGVRVADPWALWRTLRESVAGPAAAPDPDLARRLALEAGARRFVLGSALRTGDRLDVTLRIYAGTSPEPTHTVAVTGSVTELPALVQRLAVAVIQRVWEEEQLPEVRTIAGYTTASADALKAYLDARAALRRGMLDSADRAIDRAVALDSNFALALVEATRIKSWTLSMRGQPYRGLTQLVERAATLLDSLSDRNRLRVIAAQALIQTDGVTAVDAARQLVQIDSTDLEGWEVLRYSHQAYGWQYGARLSDVIDAADHIVRLDSAFLPGLVGRAALAGWAGVVDADDMARQMARLERADTTAAPVAATLAALRAIQADDRQFDAMLPALAAAPPERWVTIVRALRTSRPARADSLLVRLAAAPGPQQPSAFGALLDFWIAEGNHGRADSVLRAAGNAVPLWLVREVEFDLVAAQLAAVGDSAVAARTVAALQASFDPDSAVAQIERRPVWRAGWTIGAYNATYGDTALARRWGRALEPLRGTRSTSADWVGALQADFEARMASRRGDLPTALREAERAYRLWTVHTENLPAANPEPAMRFHLGMLHLAQGRPDSAEAFLRSLVPPTTWMGFLSARSWFELGQIAERRGDFEEAAGFYAQALDLWNLGGAEIADWRERAQTALERVTRRAG